MVGGAGFSGGGGGAVARDARFLLAGLSASSLRAFLGQEDTQSLTHTLEGKQATLVGRPHLKREIAPRKWTLSCVCVCVCVVQIQSRHRHRPSMTSSDRRTFFKSTFCTIQSINQSSNRSNEQSDQSIDQSINQSNNQSIKQ